MGPLEAGVVVALAVYIWILTFAIGLVLTSAVNAGVTTMLVCIYEDPATLIEVDPSLNKFIFEKYPGMLPNLTAPGFSPEGSNEYRSHV